MFDWYYAWLEAWPWLHYVIAALIILVFLMLRKLFTRFIFAVIKKVSKHGKSHFLGNLLYAFEKPMRMLIVVLGVYFAVMYLNLQPDVMVVVNRLLRTFLIVFFGWGFFNFSGTSSDLFTRLGRKVDGDQDSMLIPFISRVLRGLIIVLMFTVIAMEWDYDINGFIAGLGLGGLAFALAAQDTIANFFGGIILVTEKPFKRGDWVETSTIEGVVEDIAFRSTKVRTFAEGLVTIPNSTIANDSITNWSEMRTRQVFSSIYLKYNSPVENVRNVLKRVDQELRDSPEVHPEEIEVYVREFEEYGMEMLVYYFTNATPWTEWLKVKEYFNMRILEILEEENVEIAIPMPDLYKHRDPS
ncbi:mechanosensitive ion channel family protein [Salicibibacter cibarius]|uniref:Mechanosensitive ion channel family protein n=1 Tax=Salicibibacter cibarius TaxID=2743000 RepID=A0A7T6Z4E7_9BACI|nr:mechanosensitive ion channel family protein [Salicibibacter cibarius]QQK76798.1 mechanosensitive ion channel family protein [Salicibibacter cibarius]